MQSTSFAKRLCGPCTSGPGIEWPAAIRPVTKMPKCRRDARSNMAKKKNSPPSNGIDAGESEPSSAKPSVNQQLPPAEVRYADDLQQLAAADAGDRPENWLLTPQSVVDFICGTDGEKIGKSKQTARAIEAKFVGPR